MMCLTDSLNQVSHLNLPKVYEAVLTAIKAGYRHIDTAWICKRHQIPPFGS